MPGRAEVARVSHTAAAVQAAGPAAGPAWIVAQSDPLAGDTPGNPGDGAAITEPAGAAAEQAADPVLPPPPIGTDRRVTDPEGTQPIEELPAPTETQLLDLETVLISATESFPSVREAAQLRAEALGESQRALGEFDDRLEAFTINQPMGFYQNYRHGISWSRPLENGGVAYTGYRIGRGRFEPWYGGRDTDDSGEFRVGFEIPLLQNRAIDPRRTAVRLAALDIQRASPELFQQVLGAQVEAAEAYWQWVAAGQRYEIAEELMMLAEERVERIQRQIDAEDVARIVGVDNRRLLAQRRSLLIEARRAWDAAAVRLSLYYRNPAGVPISVADAALPEVFPEAPSPAVNLEIDITEAMDLRPELAILRIASEQLRTELRLAINQQLPKSAFRPKLPKMSAR
jgi:hypothetical protein